MVTFLLDREAVGSFDDEPPPACDGEYAYEPYRSLAHYKLGLQLAEGLTPRCYYISAGKRVEFTVAARSGYGRLRLIDFSELDYGVTP